MPATLRLFAALVPPPEAVEHVHDFVEPRLDADPALRWSQPHQWHVTLAFAAAAPEYLLDELLERLTSAAGRHHLPAVRIAGGGAFPHPDAARVLWTGLQPEAEGSVDGGLDAVPAGEASGVALELAALARATRTAFATTGIPVDGRRFRAHVTLARLRRPANVSRWVRLLDSYRGPAWQAEQVTLIASHLGEGPRRAPRYEVVGAAPLA